jgi:hypothetical protein
MTTKLKQLNEFEEEAVGLLQRTALLNGRLIVEFDWGKVEVILDASEADSAREELNKRVGTAVGLFFLTRPSGNSVLKLREVSN